MKLIIAIIRPSQLESVREALTESEVHGITVSEVKGYGRQKGHSEIYRGAEYAVHFVPKLKLEIALPAKQVDTIIPLIQKAAETGRIGDGKIFVLDLESAMRVRTGETGLSAL